MKGLILLSAIPLPSDDKKAFCVNPLSYGLKKFVLCVARLDGSLSKKVGQNEILMPFLLNSILL